MNRILISTASALALMAGTAGAQSFSDQAGGATVLDTISVTANRTPTEKNKTGSKVEQVTKEEIEEKSLVSVRDYLIRLPGISLTANGGLGATSNLYVRACPAATSRRSTTASTSPTPPASRSRRPTNICSPAASPASRC